LCRKEFPCSDSQNTGHDFSIQMPKTPAEVGHLDDILVL
jgi:hypothetical protein